jgi:hypothetical protein
MEMAKELPVVPRYVLNPYRPPKIYLPQDEARINKTSYTQTQIVSFALALREVQPHVTA